MHISSIIYLSILSLISCTAAAPAPLPIFIEVHWKAKLSGVAAKTKEDKAKLEHLRVEVKSTMKLIKDLVTRAHKHKDPASRKVLHELAGPKASISTISSVVRFMEAYTLRVYEFSFKNEGENRKKLAHISASSIGDRMSISEKFWELSVEEQVGVMFHEVSHRAGTVDWWKEKPDGKIVPVKEDPSHSKETNGFLSGYRQKSYWKIYEKAGNKFIYNADFWYALAIYVRRLHEGRTGDDLYSLSLRKSHPLMSQRLTPQLQNTATHDPIPTSDNDSFDNVINAEEQYPFYDSHPVPLESDDGGVVSGTGSVRTGLLSSGNSISGASLSSSDGSQDDGHLSQPPSPELGPPAIPTKA